MLDTQGAILPKQQYSVVLEINAPIEKCFAAGTAEDAMMHWVPGIKTVVYDQSRAEEPYGAGSERRVTLKTGMAVVEKIFISEKPVFVAYTIPRFGFADALIKNYQGRMNFTAISESRTRLVWNGYFDADGARKITEPVMRAVLRTLIATMAGKLKKYVERG
jgi:uncharacterized protein YndB with AHSA1/START domain